jgi:hypothetical protein
VADVPSGLSLTPPRETEIKNTSVTGGMSQGLLAIGLNVCNFVGSGNHSCWRWNICMKVLDSWY